MAAAQHHVNAVYNLEEARRRGKEHGKKRRQELRDWVEEGGMSGMGSSIGKGRKEASWNKQRPPDSALDADGIHSVPTQ
jgi:hypothetical protein